MFTELANVLSYFFGREAPRKFISRSAERVVCDPSNPYIVREHLVCAAQESMLDDTDDAALFFTDAKASDLCRAREAEAVVEETASLVLVSDLFQARFLSVTETTHFRSFR